MTSPLQLATSTTSTAAPDQAAAAIAYARAQLGKPYAWGATGPNSFDCSGLVQAAYKAAGVNLPRTTYQQILKGSPVAKSDLQPGDLVFPDLGHVSIYTGGGQVIEAPHLGSVVVERPMWGFMAARRVVTPTTATSGAGGTVSPASFSLGSLNPASWGDTAQSIGLKLAVVGAGLGLLLLGAARLVAPTAAGIMKEAL